MPRQGANCVQVPLGQARLRVINKRWLGAAHRASLRVHVWTVNDEATMHRLLDAGVDGIMTDRLRLLRDVVASRGLSLGGDAPTAAS